MDYILRISGDFEKGGCEKCPLSKKYACVGEDSFFDTYLGCIFQEIEGCPLEEVKQGEWIFSEWGYPDRTLTCNKCGYKYEGIDYTAKANHTLHNFCPNCGADMRGDN